MKRRGLASVVLLVGLATTSCSSFGAGRLVSSHMAYNDAVQLSVTREVLANIVRSRYADPMQFLLVSAVNAQFSVSAQGAVGVGDREALDSTRSTPAKAPGLQLHFDSRHSRLNLCERKAPSAIGRKPGGRQQYSDHRNSQDHQYDIRPTAPAFWGVWLPGHSIDT